MVEGLVSSTGFLRKAQTATNAACENEAPRFSESRADQREGWKRDRFKPLVIQLPDSQCTVRAFFATSWRRLPAAALALVMLCLS
jgi:hypothetical protein